MSYAVDGPSGGYWALIGVNTDSGVLASTLPSIMDLSFIYGDAGDIELFSYGLGVLGGFMASSTTTSWTAAAGVYADSFTPQLGTTMLYLYTLNDAMDMSVLVDTYIIPEPATIALLCLGGLMLRRKK